MTSELTPTLGTEWRKSATVVLRLPSGRVARIRAVGPDVILRHGSLPDSLTPIIARIMDGNSESAQPQTLDDLRGMTDFINIVCRCAMVDPRVVDEPTDDHEIGIDDMDWPDKEFLMGAVGASTRLLENFRDQQAGYVDAVVSSEGHPPRRKRDPEPEPVGTGHDGA